MQYTADVPRSQELWGYCVAADCAQAARQLWRIRAWADQEGAEAQDLVLVNSVVLVHFASMTDRQRFAAAFPDFVWERPWLRGLPAAAIPMSWSSRQDRDPESKRRAWRRWSQTRPAYPEDLGNLRVLVAQNEQARAASHGAAELAAADLPPAVRWRPCASGRVLSACATDPTE